MSKSKHKPLLSLCVITKNEEKLIKRCLSSVQDAADECIVVDTGSTDRTVEYAKLLGARVYHKKWRDDFAWARNQAIEKANGKWILILDADEALIENQGADLRRYLEENADADGLFLQVVSHYGNENKLLGSMVMPSIRIFRNIPSYRYKGRIHEQIVAPIITTNPQAKLIFTSYKVDHYGYVNEVVTEKDKSARNIALLLKELEVTADEPFHRYNLAVEYIRLGQLEEALVELRRSRTLIDRRPCSYSHMVYKRELDALEAMGRYKEALELSREAIEIHPDFPDLYVSQATMYQRLQQDHNAIDSYNQALANGEAPSQYNTIHGMGTYFPAFFLGKLYESQGKIDMAIQHYLMALNFKADSLPPFIRLIQLLVRTSQIGEIIPLLHQMFHVKSSRTWWSIAVLFYSLGMYEQVVQIIEEYEIPIEKLADGESLRIRCKLLLEQPDHLIHWLEEHLPLDAASSKYYFYAAIKSNDAHAASRFAQMMKDQEIDALIGNVYEYVLWDQGAFSISPELTAHIQDQVWNELSFLYGLAESAGLHELRSRIKGYWREVLRQISDPISFLQGQHMLVKALHVRVHHLLLTAPPNMKYQHVWGEISTKLITYVDDLTVGEVL
ncbi:glycosyltransferase [Paenibacillus sp. N1-5-1-14]|uniref:glycosyltransferase n=1 Tax=Paenibacillus radicibacter TaxID=2972488 RepID=UPI0021591EE8|nr:glycosyltransferase [Paenibacillus radicibacter]MCR8642059.1 glycosyltransferase [Paenibacillus radicibacter]